METSKLSPKLNLEYESIIENCNKLFYRREYKAARKAFMEAYRLLLENQPTNSRIHKGAELFNIASTYVRERKPKTAFKYFVRAYIEDLFTYGEKAESAPAAQVLLNIYKIKIEVFREIQSIVRAAEKEQQIIKNPQEIIDASPILMNLMKNKVVSGTIPKKRKVGQFKSKWEERVFVGGNYKDMLVILKQIKEIVERCGLDPIFAEDFEIPKKEIHHHSLMLLHECKGAIFEISSEAGQLLEIERLRDYGIEPLIIYQSSESGSEPKVTAMVTTLCARYNWKPQSYSNYAQLKKQCETYLNILTT